MAGTSIKIRGLEPPGLDADSGDIRRSYWTLVARLASEQKRREILKGIGADGRPLKPISEETKKNRRSEMTPTGKGHPNAPPLIPGWEKSRTFSLLASRAFTTHCELYWRFDAWSGMDWGTILGYQRDAGRNTIGLCKKSIEGIKAKAWKEWAKIKAGAKPYPSPLAIQTKPMGAVPSVGRMDLTHATMGIGRVDTAGLTAGNWSGGMTIAELKAHFRSPAEAAIPGLPPKSAVSTTPRFNTLLTHVWGPGGKPGGPAPGPKPPKPKAPPKPAPKPAAKRPSSPITEATLEAFATEALDSARAVPATLRYRGGNKVWISDMFDIFLDRNPGVSEATFKLRLAEAMRAGHVSLATSDLPHGLTSAETAKRQRSAVELIAGVFRHFLILPFLP